jgi:hypothetical protein
MFIPLKLIVIGFDPPPYMVTFTINIPQMLAYIYHNIIHGYDFHEVSGLSDSGNSGTFMDINKKSWNRCDNEVINPWKYDSSELDWTIYGWT